VLIGGTAGIEDDGERAARHAQDQRTAQRIADEGLGAFLEAWVAQPLFAGLPAERQFREERLTNTVDGLAGSITAAGTGAQAPSWDQLERLTMPVLVVAGALDTKFAALAERMVTTIGPNAQLALIAGAGHAAHLERPAAFLSALRPWLAAHGL
jgi:2-succinyl-6-hydroxy-2,4-cyclohexadiene-1-carboxylate synthase